MAFDMTSLMIMTHWKVFVRKRSAVVGQNDVYFKQDRERTDDKVVQLIDLLKYIPTLYDVKCATCENCASNAVKALGCIG